MQIFEDAENQTYNVVIVSEYPCGNGMGRHSEIVNHQPVDFSRANQWVHGIMTGIGRDWKSSRYTDIYMELATCRRPLTPELQSMLSREELRRNAEPDYDVVYAGFVAKQDIHHGKVTADLERMAADVARPDRTQFWQGETA